MLKVELIDHMGSDITVVNAARVSLDKHITELRDADRKLLGFLATHKHFSPFRHVQFQFRITAPEFIARQMFKHNVGIQASSGEFQNQSDAWNEISQRYVTVQNVFTPGGQNPWRKAPEERRQGSSTTDQLTPETQAKCQSLYDAAMKVSLETYQQLLTLGVAKEMARMVLPMSIETKFYWTMSLQAVHHFVALRRSPDAQLEIQILAAQMEEIVQKLVPESWRALGGGNPGNQPSNS